MGNGVWEYERIGLWEWSMRERGWSMGVLENRSMGMEYEKMGLEYGSIREWGMEYVSMRE